GKLAWGSRRRPEGFVVTCFTINRENSMSIRVLVLLLLGMGFGFASLSRAEEEGPWTIQILTTEGEQLVGEVESKELPLEGKADHSVGWSSILSYHSAQPPSEFEQRQIDEAFPLLDSKKVTEAERAAATLGPIGLPVMTRLLQSFTDDDGLQPGYRYRLYE